MGSIKLLLLIIFSIEAKEVIEKVEDLMRGTTSEGTYRMVLTRPEFKKEIRFKFWEDRKKDRSLTLILSPKKDRGISYLKIGTNLWMYLPKVRRTIRIPPSMMMNSWMGSDFTNDDISRESSISRDYEARVLEEKVDTVILELRPKKDIVTVWEKIILKVLLPNIPLEATYFNQKGEEVRKVYFKKLRNFSGRRMPSILEAIPKKKENQKTVLFLEEVRFGKEFEEDFFTIENLEKLARRELR